MTQQSDSVGGKAFSGDGEKTQWLMRYESWLKVLAGLEIDSRFRGKFSASDAVQQTLLEAWKDWDRFKGNDEPQRLAWLRAILAHQLAHLARHYAGTQKRDVTREASLQHSLAESSHRLSNMLSAPVSSPSAQLEAKEQQLHLADVLDKLPDDYREIIILRNLQQLSHKEIAERLGRSEGAIRMLWVRALTKLREEIEKG